jgi:hypothetical protein
MITSLRKMFQKEFETIRKNWEDISRKLTKNKRNAPMNFWKKASEKKPRKARKKKQSFTSDSSGLPDSVEPPFKLLKLGNKTNTLEGWIKVFEALEIVIFRDEGKCVSHCYRPGFSFLDVEAIHADSDEALKMCLEGSYHNLSQLLLFNTGEALPEI